MAAGGSMRALWAPRTASFCHGGENLIAYQVARESFPRLAQFKDRPEKFQALRTLQKAAVDQALDASVFESVRAGLSA